MMRKEGKGEKWKEDIEVKGALSDFGICRSPTSLFPIFPFFLFLHLAPVWLSSHEIASWIARLSHAPQDAYLPKSPPVIGVLPVVSDEFDDKRSRSDLVA